MLHLRKMTKAMSGKILGMTMIKLLAVIGILGIIITVTINNWTAISNKFFAPTPPKICQSSQGGCGNSS